MTANPENAARIAARCLEIFDAGEPRNAADIAEALMSLPEIPMHSPDHHFLVPAALLTAANLVSGDRERLDAGLAEAARRASQVPGGVCGSFGCCGAAVGAGIFCSVWNRTCALSKTGWAAANETTARALSAIASVEGPRCCKRVTYLAVGAVLASSKELLGLDLGEMPAVVCRRCGQNRECRGPACPFFPKRAEAKT